MSKTYRVKDSSLATWDQGMEEVASSYGITKAQMQLAAQYRADASGTYTTAAGAGLVYKWAKTSGKSTNAPLGLVLKDNDVMLIEQNSSESDTYIRFSNTGRYLIVFTFYVLNSQSTTRLRLNFNVCTTPTYDTATKVVEPAIFADTYVTSDVSTRLSGSGGGVVDVHAGDYLIPTYGVYENVPSGATIGIRLGVVQLSADVPNYIVDATTIPLGQYLAPDYATMETINRISAADGTWTVTRDGYIRAWMQTSSIGVMTVQINNKTISRIASTSTANPTVLGDIFPVSNGDVVKFVSTATLTACYCYFIYPKQVTKPIVYLTGTDNSQIQVQTDAPDYGNRTLLPSTIYPTTTTAANWTYGTDYTILEDGYVSLDIRYSAGTSSSIAHFGISVNGIIQYITRNIMTGLDQWQHLDMVRVTQGDRVCVSVYCGAVTSITWSGARSFFYPLRLRYLSTPTQVDATINSDIEYEIERQILKRDGSPLMYLGSPVYEIWRKFDDVSIPDSTWVTRTIVSGADSILDYTAFHRLGISEWWQPISSYYSTAVYESIIQSNRTYHTIEWYTRALSGAQSGSTVSMYGRFRYTKI